MEAMKEPTKLHSDIRCLSVRQPWAWLLVNGFKPIENRTWQTLYRGPLLIHASTKEPQSGLHVNGIWVPASVPLGGIVGVVSVVGCVHRSNDPWFEGPFGWQVQDGTPLPFVPVRGLLSLFRPPSSVWTHVRASPEWQAYVSRMRNAPGSFPASS